MVDSDDGSSNSAAKSAKLKSFDGDASNWTRWVMLLRAFCGIHNMAGVLDGTVTDQKKNATVYFHMMTAIMGGQAEYLINGSKDSDGRALFLRLKNKYESVDLLRLMSMFQRLVNIDFDPANKDPDVLFAEMTKVMDDISAWFTSFGIDVTGTRAPAQTVPEAGGGVNTRRGVAATGETESTDDALSGALVFRCFMLATVVTKLGNKYEPVIHEINRELLGQSLTDSIESTPTTKREQLSKLKLEKVYDSARHRYMFGKHAQGVKKERSTDPTDERALFTAAAARFFDRQKAGRSRLPKPGGDDEDYGCSYYKETDHQIDDCPTLKERRCDKCGEQGHTERFCPTSRSGTRKPSSTPRKLDLPAQLAQFFKSSEATSDYESDLEACALLPVSVEDMFHPDLNMPVDDHLGVLQSQHLPPPSTAARTDGTDGFPRWILDTGSALHINPHADEYDKYRYLTEAERAHIGVRGVSQSRMPPPIGYGSCRVPVHAYDTAGNMHVHEILLFPVFHFPNLPPHMRLINLGAETIQNYDVGLSSLRADFATGQTRCHFPIHRSALGVYSINAEPQPGSPSTNLLSIDTVHSTPDKQWGGPFAASSTIPYKWHSKSAWQYRR